MSSPSITLIGWPRAVSRVFLPSARLFAKITKRRLVRAGIGERALANEIRDLANDLFGITRHWHTRIVRSGENTLETARGQPIV